MASIMRSAIKIGLLFIIIGGVAVGIGIYFNFTEQPESKFFLSIHKFDNGSNSSGKVVDFNQLSPSEQRIFLEAYTNDDNISKKYKNIPKEWFSDFDIIRYRSELYRVSVGHSDVSSIGGSIFMIIGAGAIFIGLWLAVPSYFYKKYN